MTSRGPAALNSPLTLELFPPDKENSIHRQLSAHNSICYRMSAGAPHRDARSKRVFALSNKLHFLVAASASERANKRERGRGRVREIQSSFATRARCPKLSGSRRDYSFSRFRRFRATPTRTSGRRCAARSHANNAKRMSILSRARARDLLLRG